MKKQMNVFQKDGISLMSLRVMYFYLLVLELEHVLGNKWDNYYQNHF
jgi:hypothetical protein